MKINKYKKEILESLLFSLDDKNSHIPIVTHKDLGLSHEEWSKIIDIMQDEELIKGYKIVDFNGSQYPYYRITTQNPSITAKGIEYLEQNKTSKKILNFIKVVKDTTPGL